MQQPGAVISLRNITKRFPGVIANDNVSLDIRAGEIHVLLGENGAGKSTLIGLLSGMQQPDDGKIIVDGKPTRIRSPRHALSLGIGTVFQHRMLVPVLTVAENLLLGNAWWRRPRRFGIRERFEKVCADFGIKIDLDTETSALSLGEQQQVEIIRAVWRGGRVIILDEPTAMLTQQGIAQLGMIMRRMKESGAAVIFITHHLSEALEFGDRISVLRQGRVAGELECNELRAMSKGLAINRIVGLMFGEMSSEVMSDSPKRATRPKASGQPRLSVGALSVRGPQGRLLVDNISFEVMPGEVFGIAGVDGNGQTHLAQAIAGQISAQGIIALDGVDLVTLGVSKRHRLGIRYLTDDRLGEGVVGSLPVSINLLLKRIGADPFWSLGIKRGRLINRHADTLIQEFDIRTPSGATPIGRLSGGNIQKALLARELDRGAVLVVYNKSSHGLDLRTTAVLHRRIVDDAAAGLGTILISTDLDEVLGLSDRIGVMVRGHMTGIIENGPDARLQVGTLMTGASVTGLLAHAART